MSLDPFTEEQKHYLSGFAAGSGLAQTLGALPTFAATLGLSPAQAQRPRDAGGAAGDAPHDPSRAAQDRTLAEGKTLCKEENAKRARNGLDLWDEIAAHAREGKFPKGTDGFLFKFQGMFYVAPAQDSFMCRLRLPAGLIRAEQLRGVADLADTFAGGYADITTRSNLQLREIKPFDTIHVLQGLHDLGIINRGSGADNVRNITASPTAGIDPHELIDTRPLARDLHHYILNHRELYGLPRKFNVAYDGGGSVSTLEDTNDIGFAAVRVSDANATADVPPGIYCRLTLGGITGHGDFARDTGILLKPQECLPAAVAILRAFIDHGDRTDRKKARLKYVLERLGFDAFVSDVDRRLPEPMRRFPLADCEPRRAIDPAGHIGLHEQKQQGLWYAGVVLPIGRMTSEAMRKLADLASRYGSGTLRLTVWQNVLISDIAGEHLTAVKRELEAAGLDWRAAGLRAGIVACTGNAGCKYAATNTKLHALRLAEDLAPRLPLEEPLNVHLTGCHHSCAQHYIGDIGLLGTKVPAAPGSDDLVEGYRVYLGGGYGANRGIGREVCAGISAEELPAALERMLTAYLAEREEGESFRDYARRRPDAALSDAFQPQTLTA